MLEKREQKIKNLIRQRQSHLTVILENVRDPHNIGAVLRTCDAVGIREIFFIQDSSFSEEKFVLGKRASSGARKWVDVFEFEDVQSCIHTVRSKGYEYILATRMVEGAQSLYDYDLSLPTAFIFGNEHFGVSEEATNLANGNFIIPQVGMVQSLNISVACAITLYEAFRQRKQKGFYDENPNLPEDLQAALFERYAARELIRHSGRHTIKKNSIEAKDKI